MNGNKRRNYLACRWITPGPLGRWYKFLTLSFYSLCGRLLNGHRCGIMWATWMHSRPCHTPARGQSVDGRNIFRKNCKLSMTEFWKFICVLAILPQSNWKMSSSKLYETGVHQQFRETREAPGYTLLFAGCLLTGALGVFFCCVLLWPLFRRMKLVILWGTSTGRFRCMSQLFCNCQWRGLDWRTERNLASQGGQDCCWDALSSQGPSL